MGANTVSNHNLAVVTKGTPHNATTKGKTDKCNVPPVPTPTNFVNYVPSSQLGPGQTTKTFIAQNPIVTKRAIISPPSKDPHAGILGGVTSGTYLMEATMVGASPDVFAEGSPVCRSTDATKQNHGNTDGSWIEGDVLAYLAKQIENQKKRCTIVKIEAHCAHKGRPLGFPPGESQAGKDGYYLEVLSVDEVTFKATRKSVVPGETEPDCMYPGEHTKWVITRTGPGEAPLEKKLAGDDQIIGRDVLAMLLDETLLGVTPKFKTQGDKVNPDNNDFSKDDVKAEKDAFGKRVRGAGDEQRAAASQAGNDAYKSRPLSSDEQSVKDRTANGSHIPKYRKEGAKEMDKLRKADATKASDDAFKDANKQNKAADRKIMEAVNLGVNFAKLALLWYAKRNPVVVQIEASACSGSKNAKLVVLPSGKAKFDLFSDKLQQVFQNIKAVGLIIQKIGKWCGVNAQVKFLEKPGVSITIEYKELTEDKNKHVKSEANRAWDFVFQFDPFLLVRIEVAVPLPTFLSPMGALLSKILKYFGAEGVVFVAAEVNIAPVGAINIDEYDSFGGYLKATVKITLELGIRIRWGDTAEIWASAYVETTIEFPDWRMSALFIPEILAKGSVQLGFKGGAWADVWGWRKSVDFNYKPPNWSWKLGKFGSLACSCRDQTKMDQKRIIVAQAPLADGAPLGRLAVGILRWTDPVPTLTLVVKLTFSFGQDATVRGNVAHMVLAVEPDPLRGNVLVEGPDGQAELRYPSDFAPLKAGTDVMLVGHAYAGGAARRARAAGPPGASNEATVETRIPASIRVGEIDRTFYVSATGEHAELPLKAPYLRDGGGGETEPVGPIATPTILTPPAYHTPGFDYASYNAAALVQRMPEIDPGTEVRLRGLSARADERTIALPDLVPRVFIDHRDRAQLTETYLFCDTVLLDTDRERCVLVFRGIVELESLSAAEITRLVITLDSTTSLRSDGDILRELPRGEFFYASTPVDVEPGAPPIPDKTVELTMARFATWGHVDPPEPRTTLERYAAVSAGLTEGREARAEVFRKHEVDGESWLLEERAWSSKISGDRAIARQFGELFVIAQDALAEPHEADRTVEDYVQLSAAMERRPRNEVLNEAKITPPAWQRLKRRCTAQMRKEKADNAPPPKPRPKLPEGKPLAPSPIVSKYFDGRRKGQEN